MEYKREKLGKNLRPNNGMTFGDLIWKLWNDSRFIYMLAVAGPILVFAYITEGRVFDGWLSLLFPAGLSVALIIICFLHRK